MATRHFRKFSSPVQAKRRSWSCRLVKGLIKRSQHLHQLMQWVINWWSKCWDRLNRSVNIVDTSWTVEAVFNQNLNCFNTLSVFLALSTLLKDTFNKCWRQLFQRSFTYSPFWFCSRLYCIPYTSCGQALLAYANRYPWLISRQLLLDCGIGVSSSSPGSSDLSTDPVVSQHRVLLFCQLKSMLDIVENDLLKWDCFCLLPLMTANVQNWTKLKQTSAPRESTAHQFWFEWRHFRILPTCSKR